MKKLYLLPLLLLLTGCSTRPTSIVTPSDTSSDSSNSNSSTSISDDSSSETNSSSIIKATAIYPLEENINLQINQEKEIKVKFDIPTFEEDYSLSSSDPSFVEVNGKNIIAKKVTSTPVTITITSVSGLTNTCKVNVFPVPTSLELTTDTTSSSYLSPILPINKSKEIIVTVDNDSLANLEYEFVKNEADASITISSEKINTFTLTATKEGAVDFKIYDKSNKAELYDQAYIYFYDSSLDESLNRALANLSRSNFKVDNDVFTFSGFDVDQNDAKAGTISYDYESSDGTASYEASYVISNKAFTGLTDLGNDGDYEITTDDLSINFLDNDVIELHLENSDYEETNITLVRS